MASKRQLTAIIAGATAIFSAHMFGGINYPVWESLSANAQSGMTFIPPVDQNPGRSAGSGSRGCSQESLAAENLVTLLIPSTEYAGQTTSGHPSFFWYMSKSVDVPVKFSLVQKGVPQPLYETEINAPAAGIIQVDLPADKPELATGEVYTWSVSLVCNPDSPSANPFYYSSIERKEVTPELEEKLAAEIELSQKASVYAAAGLWYDTLAALSQAYPENLNEQPDFQALLEQVGLNEVLQK